MFKNFLFPFKQTILDKSISLDVALFSILFFCLPIVLITGPAIPDIFLSLIALFFLVKSVLMRIWKYYKNPLVFGFLIFSFYGIIRSLFTDIPIESLTNEGSVFYFRYIFFAMGTWYLLDNNPYLSKCLLIVSIACLLIVSFDGLFQYLTGFDFFGNQAISLYRISGLFGNEPIMGRYIAFLSIFTFALIYQNLANSRITLMLSVAFLVMSEVIVFLSGERVPLFHVTLFTILILIFIPHYRIYRLVGIFASFIIVLVILQINPNAKERMIGQTLDEMSETNYPFLPYNVAYQEHYISAIKMFKDSPVFGVGTNTYRFQSQKSKFNSDKIDINSHPHQFYLQVLAELGIIGFLFLISFFLFLTYLLIRQFFFIIKSKNSQLIPFDQFIFILILFTYWWPLIPHMSLYNNWNNVLLMLPLGFFMKGFYGKKNI
ncbi:O-antigen ligase family protein [Alphaproteobacteria bacterium]|nr:O-antigen ligase family protein [Alphaproteobacteria bacterium]